MKQIDNKAAQVHFHIALVVSRFNEEVTERLLQGSLQRLEELGFTPAHITVAWVPGAVEIPIVAQRLAKTGKYEAIVALGAVIRGETTHYDYVCDQVSDGCSQVALRNDIPVIFGILTTENDEQAMDRVEGRHGHKGRDAIDSAVEMVATLREIG